MFARLMGIRTLSPSELDSMLQDVAVTIVDVNSRESWRTARVPRAVNLDAVAFQEADLPADKSATLVFYCSNPLCRKAPTAARRARRMGYADVRVLSAGIRGWISAALPTESGEVA